MHPGRAIWVMPDALGMPARFSSRYVTDRDAILRRCVNGQAWVPDLSLAVWCLSAAWELGNCLVVVDEAHNVWTRDLPRRSGLLRILLEGRRRGISIIMATQRPALLHPVAQNVCLGAAIGTATMAADGDLFRRLYGLREPMPLNRFLLWNPSVEPRSVIVSSSQMR